MPENQSEGAGGNTAPEDLLFDDPSSPNQTEATPQPAPQTEPHAEPQGDATQTQDEPEVNDQGNPADALDDPSPADALGEEGGEEGDGGERAPATYEQFEIPEGVETFGEPVVAAFREVASELGLTQEQAQKIIDKIGPAQLEAQQSVVKNAVDSWVETARADKEIGGANYTSSLKAARRAVDRFATPEFRKLLVGKGTQLANHPEMLRFLARVGAATSADRVLVRGKQAPSEPKVDVNDPLATQDATAELMFSRTDI